MTREDFSNGVRTDFCRQALGPPVFSITIPPMTVCPWCKEQVATANETCPHCGKNAADHPSISSAGYANLGGGLDDFEDSTELDLDGSHQPFDTVGGGHIDFGDEDESAELSVAADPKKKASPQLALKQPSLPPTPPVAPPPVVDPVDVAVMADFGPVPEEFWLCPQYAFRVIRRKRDLKQQLQGATATLASTREKLDSHLASLGERLRPRVANRPDLEPLLAPIKAAEEQEAGRKNALAASNAEYSERANSVDNKIAEETTQTDEIRKKAVEARAAHDAAQNDLGRAQAQLRRAEIELRAVQDAARASAGPDAKVAPPEFAPKILAAQQTVDERKGLVPPLQAQVDAARKTQRELDARVAESDRKLAMLRAERKKLEDTFSREFGVRADGVNAAQKQLRDALVTLALHLSSPNLKLVTEQDMQDIHSYREEQVKASLHVELLSRALESADPKAFKLGIAVVAGGSALVVSLLALIVIVFGSTAAN